jgi:hypothetical protein
MELRVHGVGGPSPQSVIGCPEDEPAVATWRSEPSAFTAVRRSPVDPSVLAYDWRPLTSGSKAFALWPVLLPYCLLNLAGWMRPARRSALLGGAARVVAVLIGYAATVATVVWLLLAGQVLTRAPGTLDAAIVRRLPGSELVTRWWLGVAASVGAVVVVLVASVHVDRGLDRYRPAVGGTVPPDPPPWRVWSRSMPDLSSPVFFDTVRDHRRRWRRHAAIVAASAIGVIVLVVWRGVEEPFSPLGDAVVWVGGGQLGLLGLGVLLSIGRGGTWQFAGVSAATIGTMLIGGLTLSGLMLVTSMEALPPGPALMAFDAYGLALGVGGLVAVACVVRRLLHPLRGDESLASSAARRWARLARLTGDIGLVLTAVGITFLVSAAVLFAVRYWGDDRSTWRLTGNPLVTIGRSALLAVMTFMVLNLVKARANPESLRRVGRVWDVICFWPRTFHPFAVRPYSERAVPELRVLMSRKGWSHGLQVTAHSQGAVLVYAALFPDALAAHGAALAPPGLGVVTFGCPLRTIYARAFPSQIDVARFDVVRCYLGGRWQNVFRSTDPVGRAVFSESTGPLGAGDLVIIDPAPGSKRVMGHDGYWATPAVRAVVAGWSGP